MNKEVEFQKELQMMRKEMELIGAATDFGRELVYSLKIAMGLHFVPEQVQIFKINPFIAGSKQNVVKSMQKLEKNILDAWYLKDELDENNTVIEAGVRSNIASLFDKLPSCQLVF